MNNLQRVKILLGLTNEDYEDDDLLTLLLEIAEESLINHLYPFETEVEEIPQKYNRKVLEIAVYLYNKVGIEGQVAHRELDITRTYESAGIPASMLSDVTPFVKIT